MPPRPASMRASNVAESVMADWEWRYKQHQHDYEVRGLLDGRQHPDWIITTLFYSALQLVTAVIGKTTGHIPSSHKQTTMDVGRTSATKNIAADYELLRILSENARYDYPHAQMRGKVTEAEGYFQAIQNHLNKCFK
jgi:hypothetical protein